MFPNGLQCYEQGALFILGHSRWVLLTKQSWFDVLKLEFSFEIHIVLQEDHGCRSEPA